MMQRFNCPASRPAVSIREVGLRDGLQALSCIVPTAHKQQWIAQAAAAGLREIEVGSFVPPQRLPQLADTAELVAAATAIPGLRVSVLVPNLFGAERALDAGAHALLLPLSASRAHSIANLRRTPDEAVAEIGRIRAARDARGSACRIEVGISTAFGCTLQGEVPATDVLRLLQAALDAGADEVGLADTVGFADPLQVARLFEQAFTVAAERLVCGHFHDTRGLGLANAFAAWQVGVSRFDASLAGLGGCPHAPGASGNVATEDLAFLFARMGVATGVDLPALLALRARLSDWLPGETLHGNLARAGVPAASADRTTLKAETV